MLTLLAILFVLAALALGIAMSAVIAWLAAAFSEGWDTAGEDVWPDYDEDTDEQ